MFRWLSLFILSASLCHAQGTISPVVNGGTQLVTPASQGSKGQVLTLKTTTGRMQFSDPESVGIKLRRAASEAPGKNPHNRPYMHACEPWLPSTLYYNQKCVVHGGNIFVQVGSAGTTGSTGPTSTVPAGSTDGGCTWIYVGPNTVTTDPGQTLVTRSSGLAVTAGQILNAGNSKLYSVTVGGTTSGSDPTGTGIGISDGTATLSYYGPYKPVPVIHDFPAVTKVSSVPSLTNVHLPTVYPSAVGALSAQVISAGSNYAQGDTITLNSTGGVSTQSTILTVSSVSGGAVTAATVTQAGQYTTLPALLPVTQSSTSGSGSGATFIVRWPDPWWCEYRGCYNASSTSAGRSFTYTFQPKSNTTPLSAHCAIEWYSDAPVLAIPTSNAAPHYQVYIDGVRWSVDGLPADTSATSFHNFDFTASGGRRVRRWRIEGVSNLDFRGIRVDGTSQVWAPDNTEKVTAVVISDSIVAGSAYSPFVNGNSFTHRLGWGLGWNDCWCFSQGGTGYLTAGSGSIFRSRVAEAATLEPDAWVLMGTTNDGGQTTAALQTEVSDTLVAIRALSTSPIFVLGILSIDDSNNTTWPSGKKLTNYESAIEAAVTAQNDSSIHWIPIRNDTLPWITGSWNNSGLSTSSNATTFINGNDGIHESDLAIPFLTGHAESAIRSKLLLAP